MVTATVCSTTCEAAADKKFPGQKNTWKHESSLLGANRSMRSSSMFELRLNIIQNLTRSRYAYGLELSDAQIYEPPIMSLRAASTKIALL